MFLLLVLFPDAETKLSNLFLPFMRNGCFVEGKIFLGIELYA